MHLAAKADRGPIGEPASGGQLGPFRGLALDVAQEPRFALDQERLDMPFRVRPATPPGNRHGHHDPTVRVDDDAQAARPWRSTQRVVDRTRPQTDDGRGLDDHRRAGRKRAVQRENPPAIVRTSGRTAARASTTSALGEP